MMDPSSYIAIKQDLRNNVAIVLNGLFIDKIYPQIIIGTYAGCRGAHKYFENKC